MAAGTESYSKPQYGSLAEAVGTKIGSAISMAAGARRRQNEEIEALQNKEDKTEEEKQRLLDLVSQKQNQEKGFFFKKALGTEFGGDMRRRTKGFFQTNPEDQNDPALDKQKRFQALLAAQPAGIQSAPPPEPEQPRQDGGILGSFATGIVEQVSLLGRKVDKLGDVIAGDATPKVVVNLSKSIGGVRTYFSRNNKITEEQVKIAEEQLEAQKKEAEDSKERQQEANAEIRNRSAGTSDVDNMRDAAGGSGGGLIGSLFDLGKDFLSRRRGGKRRGGGIGLGRRSRSRGVRPGTAYSSPIGPQPMNSRSPWARMGPGDRGGMFGQGRYTPRLSSRKLASGGVIGTTKPQPTQKLAAGGVLDNPTPVGGQSALIPKDTMQTAVKQDPENAKQAPAFADLIGEIPKMVAGAAMISSVASFIGKFTGGIGSVFRPVIQRLFAPAAAIFGLPVNLINAMFGMEAAAGGKPMHGLVPARGNGKNGSKNATNASTSANTSGISGTAFATNAGSISGYGVSSGFGSRVHPITGRVTQHQGTDYNIPFGKPISLKMGGKVGTGGNDFKAPDTSTAVSGIVTVDHPDGNSTRYVHLSKINVRPGEDVQPGQVIGEVGGEPGRPGGGGSTGAHLHFEYYPGGSAPANGVAVADKYFAVGGQVTPTSTSPSPTTSPTTTQQTPAAPSTTPSTSSSSGMAEPIVLPAAPARPAAPSSGGGANQLPVRNLNGAHGLRLNRI